MTTGQRGRTQVSGGTRVEALLALRREPFLDGFAFQALEAGARVGRRSISLAKHHALSRVFRFICLSIGKILARFVPRMNEERPNFHFLSLKLCGIFRGCIMILIFGKLMKSRGKRRERWELCVVYFNRLIDFDLFILERFFF